MFARVQKLQAGLVIPVTLEMASSLKLTEGVEVQVLPVSPEALTRYATVQKSLAAFKLTLLNMRTLTANSRSELRFS